MPEIFSQPVTITPADIDELGHVNNIVYLRWAQEIAIAHWQARGAPEHVSQYFWVVARHEIDYHAPLYLGDDVEVRTRVDEQGARGALWTRFVEIGKPGAKPAVSLKSDWCIMDAATRRVRRVPADLVARFLS